MIWILGWIYGDRSSKVFAVKPVNFNWTWAVYYLHITPSLKLAYTIEYPARL